jgi:hypothetical protein
MRRTRVSLKTGCDTVEADHGVEGNCHRVVVNQCRTPYLVLQLSVFSPNCALRGNPCSIFGRTTTLITTRWYVQGHVGTWEIYTGSSCLNV